MLHAQYANSMHKGEPGINTLLSAQLYLKSSQSQYMNC